MGSKAFKIGVAGIFHETNTFVARPTVEADFHSHWLCGSRQVAGFYERTTTTMGGIIDAATALGVELAFGLYTEAPPAGMVSAEAAELLLQAIVDSLDTDVDAIILLLHGAMVAEQYPDFEGECLRRVRASHSVSGEVPLVLTLDLHANISAEMVQLSDLIIGYNTFPHVDMYECGQEAVARAVEMIQGSIRPCQAYAHTGRLIAPQATLTSTGSMQALMEQAFELEQFPQVINVTVAGGFPYSDVKEAGMSFVVTTDSDPALAERLADELRADAMKRMDGKGFQVSLSSPEAAIEQALQAAEGPVILVEGSDNVGGGSPADGTYVLQHLIGIPQRALIVICDAEAVQAAIEAGTGAAFAGYVGGKTDRLHGEPVYIQGTVRMLHNGVFHNVGPYRTGQRVEMGPTAVLQAEHLTIMLTTKRTPPFDVGHIQCAGLQPAEFKLIVVKSAAAWQAAFGSYAKQVYHVDTPGCTSANLSHFQYQHASGRI